jgi:parvulin-like peptidyl-prolyl isomerase
MGAKAIFVLSVLAATALPGAAGGVPQQQPGRVVDRIVARVEGDVILLSQVRELAAFQRLVDGRAESDDRLLSELVEQWVIQAEANTSHFPQPSGPEVDREMARLAGQFKTPEAYAAKLRELGLSATAVRRMLTQQIYLTRYLDYKFRPSVQIEPSQIHTYYQKELVPELTKKHQPVPPETTVEAQIRELLIQREITNRTAKWLDDTKARLRIEITPQAASP